MSSTHHSTIDLLRERKKTSRAKPSPTQICTVLGRMIVTKSQPAVRHEELLLGGLFATENCQLGNQYRPEIVKSSLFIYIYINVTQCRSSAEEPRQRIRRWSKSASPISLQWSLGSHPRRCQLSIFLSLIHI